jgi:hypothetical protein
MNPKQKKLIIQIRYLWIALAVGVVLLSIERLFTGQKIFENFALGLGVFALVITSLIIAKIIKSEDSSCLP